MSEIPQFDDRKPLFIFDGVCVLCSGGASFLMKHDRRNRLNFTSAQGDPGKALYAHFGLEFDETYLLVEGGNAYAKSAGYLKLCAILGGWWHLLRIGGIIPEGVRDWVYAIIARNRYRWFGKADYCELLTADQRERLL